MREHPLCFNILCKVNLSLPFRIRNNFFGRFSNFLCLEFTLFQILKIKSLDLRSTFVYLSCHFILICDPLLFLKEKSCNPSILLAYENEIDWLLLLQILGLFGKEKCPSPDCVSNIFFILAPLPIFLRMSTSHNGIGYGDI